MALKLMSVQIFVIIALLPPGCFSPALTPVMAEFRLHAALLFFLLLLQGRHGNSNVLPVCDAANVPLSVHFSGLCCFTGAGGVQSLSFQAGVKDFCVSALRFSATVVLMLVSVCSAGFLGLREGPVQPRAPGLLHLCCSQSQKKEVKGETAA